MVFGEVNDFMDPEVFNAEVGFLLELYGPFGFLFLPPIKFNPLLVCIKYAKKRNNLVESLGGKQ